MSIQLFQSRINQKTIKLKIAMYTADFKSPITGRLCTVATLNNQLDHKSDLRLAASVAWNCHIAHINLFNIKKVTKATSQEIINTWDKIRNLKDSWITFPE